MGNPHLKKEDRISKWKRSSNRVQNKLFLKYFVNYEIMCSIFGSQGVKNSPWGSGLEPSSNTWENLNNSN